MLVNISGDYDLVKLKEIGEDLEEKFETISGVLDVTISGGLQREVKINVDLEKLKHYNLPFKDVIETIQNENQTIPGGSIEVGNLKYLVRIPGEFQGSAILGVSIPALAKLVSIPACSARSMTVTSAPCCRRNQAVLVPRRPLPITNMCIARLPT